MIKIFNTHTIVFTGKSSDYVTKEAVERANLRLMGLEGTRDTAKDTYATYHLPRPTREQFDKAAADALNQLAIAR